MISFFRQSIAAKITLVLSASLIVSTLVFSSVLLFSANKFFRGQDASRIADSVSKQEFKLKKFYEERIHLSRLAMGLARDATESGQLSKLLKELIRHHPQLLGFSLQDSSESFGTVIAFKNDTVIDDAFDLEDKFYQASAIDLDAGLFLFPLVEKLREGDDEEIVYLIRAKFSVGQVSIILLLSGDELVNGFQSTKKNVSNFVADMSGIFIIHQNPLKQMSYQKEIKYFLDKEFKASEFSLFLEDKNQSMFTGIVSYKGEDRELYIKRVSIEDDFSFFVGGNFPGPSGIRFSQFVGRKNSLFLFLVLILLVIGGGILTRYLLKNLGEITEQAKLFTQGEQDIDIEVKSHDEIGILALTFQGMIRQVNERTRVLRKSERRIRDARDQAEQALSSKSQLLEDLRVQKREIERVGKDKDDLLAIVSHDLKNPLAVVETSMDLILEEERGNLSEVTSDLIRRSKSSARIALNLITDLLDLARLEGGIRLDFERFSIDEVILNVVDSFFLKAREKNITVHIGKTREWEIIADYGRMVQVISNILGNSLKFTPRDGEIRISVKRYETDFTYDGSNSGVEILITDNGPGIPADKIESIFNKFEQARQKDREIGTGLGLAICKNICELHNGDVKVVSIEGEGAAFSIRLPRLIDHANLSQESVASNTSSTILVVNDNEGFRKTLKSILNQSSYSVLEARNGEEMLKLLETGLPSVIVLDYEMPVMNGLQAFKEMQRLLPVSVPTIFLGDGLASDDLTWIKKHVGDVLQGQVKEEDILQRIEALISPSSIAVIGSRVDPLKKTVLVVDDEEGIRELLIEDLANSGVNALAAKNGVEALFLLQKYVVDLVVSDIRMSEMDGITLTKIIKRGYPGIDVILVSANIEGISEKVSRNLGIKKLFLKPFEIKEVTEEIVSCLDGLTVQGPRVAVGAEVVNSLKMAREVPEALEATTKSSELGLVNEHEQEEIEEKILLVDDSEDMHALFKAILRKERINVIGAENGEEGVRIFKDNKYSAVFMDMNMPVLGGIEAVKLMREYEKITGIKPTKIILLTANSLAVDSDELKSGFDDYLQKPISKKKIIEVLRK